jgi:regulatory protein
VSNDPQENTPAASIDDALLRAIRYCEYQERCTAELSRKLDELGLTSPEKEDAISRLTDMGYVNDGRFARMYAGSKFRVNGWGKVRIRAELRARKISEDHIDKALQAIGQESYMLELESMLQQKRNSLKKYQGRELKGRLFRFATSRGYESSAIIEVLNRILID